jgi:hypothetical protein
MTSVAGCPWGYKPRSCEDCGRTFETHAPNHRYCSSCKKARDYASYKRSIAKRLDYYHRQFREAERKRRRIRRDKVLGYYSAGTFSCNCCGESEKDFLSIDHIEGEGNRFSRENGIPRGGDLLYKWLIKNGYPSGFQVLCMNCNFSKGQFGVICLHKRAEQQREPNLGSSSLTRSRAEQGST